MRTKQDMKRGLSNLRLIHVFIFVFPEHERVFGRWFAGTVLKHARAVTAKVVTNFRALVNSVRR